LSRVIWYVVMKLLFVLMPIYVYYLHKHLPFHLYSYTVKTSAQRSTKQRRGFESIILRSCGVACKYYFCSGKQVMAWSINIKASEERNIVSVFFLPTSTAKITAVQSCENISNSCLKQCHILENSRPNIPLSKSVIY
jgi:hypothetical protein